MGFPVKTPDLGRMESGFGIMVLSVACEPTPWVGDCAGPVGCKEATPVRDGFLVC